MLIIEKMSSLKEALDAVTKRKSRKRRYVRIEETLTVSEVQEVLAKQAGSSCSDSEAPLKRMRRERRCRRYKETRHNARTCIVEINITSDSDKSK